MEKQYIIGLDIGTTSVGWAVVNEENNKIIRKGNKNLWGVRLFEEGKTASKRRGYRSTRRRLDRRRNRIKLLREEFKYEMGKVDDKFFQKLDESFYNKNDLENKKIKITSEEKKQIKKYNEKYPTIYHLREELINNSEKKDIRLVYLAIHHIIKYRGNFLNDGSSFNVNNLDIKTKLRECMNSIYDNCSELEFNEDYIDAIDYDKLQSTLLLPSKNDKKLELQNELSPFFPKKLVNELKLMLVGSGFKISKLFNIELDEEVKLSFGDADYDDKISKIQFNDEIMEVLNNFKEVYDMVYLKNIFKNSKNTSISSIMVEKFDNHKEDLRYLKTVFNYDRNIYRKIFRTNSKYTCLYDRYIHNDITYTDFIKSLNKYFSEIWDKVDNQSLMDKYELEIKDRITNESFLPRITETDNGRFPYQLNKEELKKIIENQGKYYPFLLEKVDGVYKLIKLLEFKIPYYVGPLNEASKEFAWVKRSHDEKITPYNFDKMVNKEASAIAFIERMLGHCTYLFGEYAMANNSIICCEYKVLNELKQIKVNGVKLTNDFLHKVIEELFKTTKGPITDKKLKKYLLSSGQYDMYKGDIEVKGYSSDGKFANNMNSYIDFFGNDGFFQDTEYTKENAEEIIRWITIFEDKDILKNKILKEYPDLEDKIDVIIKRNYKGWSNLSKRLITEKYYVDKRTNVKKSILDLMYETDENFIQIINNKEYDFDSMINEINSKKLNLKNNKINYEVVKELATSPSTKKGIWQSLLVVDEIVKYMGYDPNKISIEIARGDEKKVRKDDRKSYLVKLYQNCKNSIENYRELKKELDEQNKIDSEKLFLYFVQEGRSLYSGKKLNIDELNTYEVDHIIPQSIIKDDSIDNKALVLKKENQDKAANLVLPEEYRKNIKWWEKLKKNNLISAKKFHNLIREQYSKEDIDGFINRQLVETRQITKHVANIFKNYYKNSKIIYLPASLSHNYREKFEMFKYRDLNDYHHAHDAYLAAVLGEYKDHFNYNVNYDLLKEITSKLYEEKKYNQTKYGFVINSIDNEFVKYNETTGEINFDADEFNKTVCNTLYQNDIIISKKTEIKTGEFYDETIYGKKSIKSKYCINDKLSVRMYGGYNSIKSSYMKLISYQKNKKLKNILIGIPIILDKNKNSDELINKYIKKNLNCDNYEVLINKIPFNIEINYNNQSCIISGCGIGAAEVVNNTQFKLSKEDQIKYKYLLNYIFNKMYPSSNDMFEYRDKLREYYKKEFDKQINQLYDLIIEKIKKYYPLYDRIANNLELVKNDFYNLNLLDDSENISKINVVKELFSLTKSSPTNADLSKFKTTINFSDRTGRTGGKNIQSGTFINKSVTGLWERKNEF